MDGYTFKSGSNNEFEIAHLDDDFDYPSFNTVSSKPFSCSKEIIAAIKRAGLYTDPDGNASLNGVFILNGSVAGTNKSRLCEEKIPELVGVDLNLPRPVWETMALEVLGDNLTIDNTSADKFFISNGDEIIIQFATSSANSRIFFFHQAFSPSSFSFSPYFLPYTPLLPSAFIARAVYLSYFCFSNRISAAHLNVQQFILLNSAYKSVVPE